MNSRYGCVPLRQDVAFKLGLLGVIFKNPLQSAIRATRALLIYIVGFQVSRRNEVDDVVVVERDA